MQQQITDLVATVTNLQVQVDASVQNAAALKTALDAALEALANAQNSVLTEEEKAALAKAATDVQAAAQALADSVALTSPGN